VRRGAPGNALIEFILTLPILIFLTGLTIYMAMAMLTKQQVLVEARYHLYRTASNGYWPPMIGVDWTDTSYVNSPRDGDMPRGIGAELDRLHGEVAAPSLARSSNAQAQDFFNRIWTNLPGRHETKSSQSFKTQGHLWDFIDRTANANHVRDSSPWHFFHIDAWKIARSGPLKEIFDAFHNNLNGDVAPHFQPTRDDILKRWWHGTDILDDEANGGVGVQSGA
jgi:hypothetical protein